ncbi:MAG: Mu transposase C-terminal domain-containing protein [Panacagrimonas sp.]
MSVATLPTVLTAYARRPVAEKIGDPFARLPEQTQDRAYLRYRLVAAVILEIDQGLKPRLASELVWSRIHSRKAPQTLIELADRCTCLSAATLETWTRLYQRGGLLGLAPKNKGRVRQPKDWEMRAIAMFAQPQRPGYSTVAYWLRGEGFQHASDHLVRRFLQSLPSNVSDTSPKRMGKHYYAQNIKPYVVRDTSALPVGMIYEGDGHCCDVYVQHPARGHFRPELTVWLDIRSQMVVGWWISESESAQTTLFSLSQALVAHNHTPAYVHTDPGSGFIARLMVDDVTGWLARFSIDAIRALPGNAKGKGLVEGWFRWFEERCGKLFPTFCGHCRTDDDLSRLSAKIKKGELQLPTLPQYIDAIKRYIDAYNNAPKDGLDGRSPAELWAQLERVPLETPAAAVLRPREARTVQRWGVRLDNRSYRAAELQGYEGREVVVEYSLHQDEQVAIYDAKGRFVCDALLVEKAAWMPASRIEQGQQKRLEGQRKRHMQAIEEQQARARLPLSAASVLHALDAPEAPRAIEHAPLHQGHSVTAPIFPAAAPRVLAPVDLAPLRAELDEMHAPQESAEQRFARALRLERDGYATDADATWLSIYQTSAEYHSRMDLHEAFSAA